MSEDKKRDFETVLDSAENRPKIKVAGAGESAVSTVKVVDGDTLLSETAGGSQAGSNVSAALDASSDGTSSNGGNFDSYDGADQKTSDETDVGATPCVAQPLDLDYQPDDALKLNPDLLPGKPKPDVLPILQACEKLFSWCAKIVTAYVVVVIGLVLLVFVGSRQIVGFADSELQKNPYTAFPLTKVVDPLYDSDQHERDYYWSALMSAKNGWLGQNDGNDQSSVHREYEASFDRLTKLTVTGATAKPYAKLLLGTVEAEMKGHEALAKTHLTEASDEITKLTNPNNFAIAMADRGLAQLSLRTKKIGDAERYATAALAIDEKAGFDSPFTLDDQRLLAVVYMTKKDSIKAERAWSDYLNSLALRHGKESLEYADALVTHAVYYLDSGQADRSVAAAKASIDVLKKHNRFNFFGFPSSSSRTFPDWITYLGIVHKAGSSQISAADARKFAEVENEFLDWYVSARKDFRYEDRKYGDLVERFADEYKAAGKYARADVLYKRALFLDKVTAPSKSYRGRPYNNIMMSGPYVRLMAKTAGNCILSGDKAQGMTIAKNCISIMDPYSHWFSMTDFSGATSELVYALGPLSARDKSRDVQQTADQLLNILQSRGMKGSFKHPARTSTMLLAEFYELQGKTAEAEAHYIEVVRDHKNSAAALGALAVFYDKQGRYAQAAALYAKAEELAKQEYYKPRGYYPHRKTVPLKKVFQADSGTFMNLGHLKKILESAPNTSYVNDPDYSWAASELERIADCKTSFQIGEKFSIHDLRPYLRDRRTIGPPGGTVYMTESARKDFASMTEAQRKEARAKFAWYDDCYPRSGNFEVLKESLPSKPLPGITFGPTSMRDMKPDVVLIIDNADADALRKMLGRPLSQTQSKVLTQTKDGESIRPHDE